MFDDFTGADDDVQQEKTQEQNAFNEYINRPEPDFKWRDTGKKWILPYSIVYCLNVTSLKWLDETKQSGPYGAVWTHQVAIVVPNKLRSTNISFAVLNGGSNKDPPERIPLNNLALVAADAIS